MSLLDLSHPAWVMALHLAGLSVFSIGGAIAMFPDIHRFMVTQQGWLNSQDFSALVALSQAAPGPNILVLTLLGYQVGGRNGLSMGIFTGVVALLAFCLPTCAIAYGYARLDARGGDALWKKFIKIGLAPITVGLMFAAGGVLAQGSGAGWLAWPIAGVSAVLAARTKLSPLWMIAGGALVGVVAL
jgi:chromate transporter